MDTATLIWIIVGIIVVAIIVVIAVMMSRRNSARKLEAQHAKAEGLREDAPVSYTHLTLPTILLV